MASILIGNIKGPKGDKGDKGDTGSQGPTGATGPSGARGYTGTRGSMWYRGTAITGTSTTAKVFSGSGITSALVNDMYLNTSTSYVYQCAKSGNASTATWAYIGSIKGAKGDKGDKGDTGAQGPQGPAGTTPSNSQMFLAAHPVGSVYESTSSTSPATTYGGTWNYCPGFEFHRWVRTA